MIPRNGCWEINFGNPIIGGWTHKTPYQNHRKPLETPQIGGSNMSFQRIDFPPSENLMESLWISDC